MCLFAFGGKKGSAHQTHWCSRVIYIVLGWGREPKLPAQATKPNGDTSFSHWVVSASTSKPQNGLVYFLDDSVVQLHATR